jgi:hypothetical protein
MCGVVRVKVGVIVIAIVTVIGLDLRCIMQLFYVCIQLCWKRNRKASRLHWGNGEHRKGYKIHIVKKFNNMIRMIR